MALVPAPGFGAGALDSKEGNLAAYVDRAVLGVGHIWRQAKVYDPEGILSQGSQALVFALRHLRHERARRLLPHGAVR
jgi:predicted acyltransferase